MSSRKCKVSCPPSFKYFPFPFLLLQLAFDNRLRILFAKMTLVLTILNVIDILTIITEENSAFILKT